MMDVFQQRYYKINKLLLRAIGQWPYQSQLRKRLLLTIFIFLAASQIIPQIMAVVDFWNDPEVVIESIPPFVIDVACGAKLANIIFNTDNMLKLVKRIEIDWKSMAHQPEIHALQAYAETGRRFTIAYTVGVYVTTVLFMTQPAAPNILSSLKLINHTEPAKFPFPVNYYGIDLETWYYYLFLHSSICVISIVTVVVAADTMFIVYVQHACGLFTAVGHQFERMAEGACHDDDYEPYPQREIDAPFHNLANCIRKHNDAIEFSQLVEASYTWCFFILVGLNMMIMSVTGFQTVTMMDDNPKDAIRYAAFTLAQMVHLFFQSYFAQRLMDHSEQVRKYLIQSDWYKTSVCAQKLMTLIIVRTHVPCQLTAGKFMVMSLENFSSMVKTSMSYFTLLRSTQ